MPNAMKVFCVGLDPQLLESRRLLLQSAGIEASCHFPHEALALLPASAFDLMIVSVSVSEKDRIALKAATPKHMRFIQLYGFVAPEDMLKMVKSQ